MRSVTVATPFALPPAVTAVPMATEEILLVWAQADELPMATMTDNANELYFM
jgi:hypothetical protein